MGAREDLLDAAMRLTDQGRSPFSPAELIADVRTAGSAYPDTTLRTFIAGPMCTNSPDNHAVQYGDLVRVSHGRYRLERGDAREAKMTMVTEETLQPVVEVVAAAGDEWFWEGNVQAVVVRHLAAHGWDIRRVADTASRERGVDVEAVSEGTRVLVEVKGYPSATYARGELAGQAKKTSPPLQARAYFSHALLAGVLMRADAVDARVVLAFPAVATYRTLADRTAPTLAGAGIEVWLVEADGMVHEVSVSGDQPK